MANEWQSGDHADVGGMPVELLHMEGSLWRCARIFPKDDSPRTLLVDERLMQPFGDPYDTPPGAP